MNRAILLLFATLFCAPVFGQDTDFGDDYSLWRLLRSGRGSMLTHGGVRDLSGEGVLTVGLLLPLEDSLGRLDRRFGEFYRGASLAVDELRSQGAGVVMRLFNTPRNADSVALVLDSPDFADTDIIVGPVYAEGMDLVVEWAGDRGVAVVSPLTVMDGIGGEVLYQMSPMPSTKYDKLLSLLLRDDVNVVYVRTARPDSEMDSALLPLLGVVPEISYSMVTPATSFDRLVDRRAAENIFVVSCLDSHLVDGILSKLSSMYSNLRSRGATSTELRVVGDSSWARFPAGVVDRELYFKVGVCYVTNYHVDRTDPRVRSFDGRYISEFGDVPPSASSGGGARPYAYRGYDAVKLFVGSATALGDDFTSKVNAEGHELLQVPYRFEQGLWGDWQNVEWPLVVYRPDYRIVVE